MSRLRTRLPALLSVWVAGVVAEALLYHFFLRQPYFRKLVSPFAVAVAIAVVVATWRMLRPRTGEDRRRGDRRRVERRAGE